jgi:hypothetical protein
MKALVNQGEKKRLLCHREQRRCVRPVGRDCASGDCGLARGVVYRNFLTTWESDFLGMSDFDSLGLAEQHRTLICRRR